MTLICRGNPKGPTGMFCRTVHNGAVQRVKHLSTPIIMARMLDAVSGSAESGSTSEQRMEEHNPQPYRLASGAGPASRTLMVARSATRMPLSPSCAAGARTGPTVLLDDAFRCACAGGRGRSDVRRWLRRARVRSGGFIGGFTPSQDCSSALLRVQLRGCGADPACRRSRSIAGHLTARLRNPGLSIAGPPACRGPARLASPSRSPAGQQS
jgi:hypothetical protein